MSEQNSVVIVSADNYSTGRSKYLSDGWISSQEKEEITPDISRPLFTKLKNQLTQYKAKQLLENQSENKEVKEIIFSTKQFKELGETQEERMLAFRCAVRDTLTEVFKETGHQNVPWAGAVHQNKEYEHAHILISKQYVDEKTGEIKSFPDYLPKQFFEKENGTTKLTQMFQTNLDKRLDQLNQDPQAKLEADLPSMQVQPGQKTNNSTSYDNFYPTKKLIVSSLPVAFEVKPNSIDQPEISSLPSSISQMPTLPADADVLDGTRAFQIREERLRQEIEKLRSEAAAAHQTAGQESGNQNQPEKNAAIKRNGQDDYKNETKELGDVPVERVFAEYGLYRAPKLGKNTWITGDGEHKINILPGNRFADVAQGKSKKDDGYLPSVSRANSINAAIYLSDGAMDFVEARAWVKDRFGSNRRTDNQEAKNNFAANQNSGSQTSTAEFQKQDSLSLEQPNYQTQKDQPVPLQIPDFDPKRQNQIESYLKNERMISPETVRVVAENETLKANDKGSAVFVLRDLEGKTTGYSLRSTWSGFRQNTDGTSKELGWYYLGNPTEAKEITIVEAPIEALSIYDLKKGESWKDKAIVSLGGASLNDELFEQLKANKSLEKVTVALNSDEPGQRAARKIAHKFTDEAPHLKVENIIPAQEEDWNDYLKVVRGKTIQPAEVKPVQSAVVQFYEEAKNDHTEEENYFEKLVRLEAGNQIQLPDAAKHQDPISAPAANKHAESIRSINPGEKDRQEEVKTMTITNDKNHDEVERMNSEGTKINQPVMGQTAQPVQANLNSGQLLEQLAAKPPISDNYQRASEDLNRLIETTARSLEQKHGKFNELVNSPEYQIAKPALEHSFQIKSDAILIEELQRSILKGDSAKLGLQPDEAISFGNRWIESVAEKNPQLNNRQFKEQNDESRRAREEIYGRIAAERIHGEFERRGLAQTALAAESGSDWGRVVDGLQGRDIQREAGSRLREAGRIEFSNSLIGQQNNLSSRPFTPSHNNSTARTIKDSISINVSIVSVDEIKQSWQQRDRVQNTIDREEWQSSLNKQNSSGFGADSSIDTLDVWQRRENERRTRDEQRLERDLIKLNIPTETDAARQVVSQESVNVPARLAHAQNTGAIENIHHTGIPRTWISAESREAASVYLLTAQKTGVQQQEQSFSLVERDNRLRLFKGSEDELKAFTWEKKMLPVTAAYQVERIESGATSVHLLVDQTKRVAVFAGGQESVTKFAESNFIKHTDAKNQTVYFAVNQADQALVEKQQAIQATAQAKLEGQLSLTTKAEQPQQQPAPVYRDLANRLTELQFKTNQSSGVEERPLTWVNDKNSFVELASVDDVRNRLWQLAEHKTAPFLANGFQSQIDSLPPQFRLREETIKTLFVEKQYGRETEALKNVLGRLDQPEKNRTISGNSEAFSQRDSLIERLKTAADQTTVRPSQVRGEQQTGFRLEAKELAFEFRDQSAYQAIEGFAQQGGSDAVNRPELARGKVHARVLDGEAALASHKVEDFELRGKAERFMIAGDHNKLVSRNEILTSTIKNGDEQLADKNIHGWSLNDAAKARTTLGQEVEMLSFVHDGQQKSLSEVKTRYNETVKNIFLPTLKLEGRMQPLTDFEQYLKSSLDPVARLKAHPLVRLVDKWKEQADGEGRLAVTKTALDEAKEKLELIEQKIAPIVAERHDERKEELKQAAEEKAEFARKLKEQTDEQQAKVAETVKPVWKQAELDYYGELAALSGNAQHLEFYRAEKLRTLSEKRQFETRLDGIIKPDEFKASAVKLNAKLSEHLFEIEHALASFDHLNKLRARGEEAGNTTALKAEVAIARADGKLDDWLKAQAGIARERAEAVTPQSIVERLTGKQTLLSTKRDELAAWHQAEFELKEESKSAEPEKSQIKFGKAFTEPTVRTKDNGQTELVSVSNLLKESNVNEALTATLKQVGNIIEDRRDSSNRQVAQLDQAAERTGSMIAETSRELALPPANQERALLTGRGRRSQTASYTELN